MKKVISMILVFAIILTCSAQNYSANAAAKYPTTNTKKVSAARVWNGKADTSWYTGKKDTYDISTPEQLAGVGEIINNGDTMYGITLNLTNDIVLNDTTDYKNWGTNAPKNAWNPIGWIGGPVRGYFPFRGHFNGNGHTISGIYVDKNDKDEAGGLFCYVSGSIISNLKIEKSYIKSGRAAGGVAGFGEYSYFDSCEVNDCEILCTYGGGPAGGIVGGGQQIHATSVLTYGLFMGVGIVINPLYWAGAKGEDDPLSGTYFVNCKVVDSSVKIDFDGTDDMFTGGIVGFVGTGNGLYNCLVADCELGAMSSFGLSKYGQVGMLIGSNSNYAIDHEIIVKNCYVSNVTRNDKTYRYDPCTEINTIGNPTMVKKSKLSTEAFAKKLGKSYTYVKGNEYPTLKSVNYQKANAITNAKNSKVVFTWEPVADAQSYKILLKGNDGNFSVVSTVKNNKSTVTLDGFEKGKSYEMKISAKMKDGTYKAITGKFKLSL